MDRLNKSSQPQNKIGVIESMLSGVASGVIAIPKGFFSLGASLMDLGVDSGKAAAVEAWFDDLTEFDEKAEATAAGKITELIVNIGIPGGIAYKGASNLAKTSMLAAKNKKYVKLNDPALIKAGQDAVSLTAQGQGRAFMAGALGGGLAEGVFVGDVEEAGTFGDLLGGPTEINRIDTDPNATREILNRIKFGTEGALFTGVLGGAGKVIKKITNRNKGLDTANSGIDRLIDKVVTGFRARSGKTQEFFDIERQTIGARAIDAIGTKNLARELDMDIDRVFPFFRNIGKTQTAKRRNEFLEELSDALVSGTPTLTREGQKRVLNAEGKELFKASAKSPRAEELLIQQMKQADLNQYTEVIDSNRMIAQFGDMDAGSIQRIKDTIKEFAPNAQTAEELERSILGGLSAMRIKWSNLFTDLGSVVDPEDLIKFKDKFGKKFKGYIGSTYDIFQEKSIIPFLRYKPAAQAVENAKNLFKASAKEAGKDLTDLEAEQIVSGILRAPIMPKGFRADKPSDALFKAPEFFVNRTVLDDALTRSGENIISIGDLKSAADRKVFDDLFGKQKNPMQTMIGGMAKLSLITRSNLFYNNLIKKNDDIITNWKAAADKTTVPQPMFARSEGEARQFFGEASFRRIEPIDPAQTLNVNIRAQSSNPFGDIMKPFYARDGIADAMEQVSKNSNKKGTLTRLYESLILYPKATSQIAKTILSPVTHLRNFVSAAAFAAANGLLPAADPAAIKQAYQALQTGLKGTRQQNELYEELLELGVVNSSVRLGDLSRLLKDVNFGETMTSTKGMRLLLKPLSKLKSSAQDLYTAEDDFWKIYSWAIEKSRLEEAFKKIGVTRGQFFKRNGVDVRLDDQFLKEEAADIVRNNIPNYDYVSDFVKSLRKLPIGNFVSFPAEIARTGTNIVRRALREISETITLADGRVVKPMESIGYTRLFGFTTTVAAVPVATTAAFQALYDVTDEEREAIRRFAAKWSKNSTLLPIKDKNGNFKYVDFSHANAYDTLLRPLQTVINSVQDGRTDNDGIMDDFSKGMFVAMKEFGEPFISESIWTEAMFDIFIRGGRSRQGFQIYSDQDTDGDRNRKIFAHLVEAQMPFSANQLKRLDRSIESVDVLTKGKYDEYGQDFEFGDEFQGLFGFRPVSVNPQRTMNFKVADYQKGVRDSRGLFTRVSLKGGPIESREVVDAYLNANRALFGVKKNLKKDIEAANLLNIGETNLRNSLDRISNAEVSSIVNGVYRPLTISLDVQRSFADNAAKIGQVNPLLEALPIIENLRNQLSTFNLDLPELPTLANPLMPIMQDTPITPNTVAAGSASIDTDALQNQVSGNNLNGMTTQQKIDILFKGN